MKKCLFCGKELTANQRHNTYCSHECEVKARHEKNVQNWIKTGQFEKKPLSSSIRKFLLELKENKCELCGWDKINPTTKKSPLEIHHIDGNYLNNTLENLQVLCPNCHSLTSNYKALNKSDRERTQVRKNYCCDCGKEIFTTSIRCKECDAKTRITKKPVTREELKQLIRTKSFVEIGRCYGVTDNAIRKWCLQYNLPSKKREINNYTQEEWDNI